MKISYVKVTALIDSVTHYEGPILAENGLSLFIEIKSKDSAIRILMDTGITGNSLIKNAKELGVNLSQVDAIVISHGHYDHTGGLLKVLKEINRKVPVIAHPEAFMPKFGILPSLGMPKLMYTGPQFSKREVEDAGGVFVLSRKPVPIIDDVLTTGEIARATKFEKVEGFYAVKDGEFRKDNLPDDQALIVKMADDSLVIFTGCGHSGIINTVNYALKLTTAKSVRAIVGGFHLIGATNNRIRKTVEDLMKINPDIIAPMHCTGFKAKSKFAGAFPEAFKEFYCGDTLEIKLM